MDKPKSVKVTFLPPAENVDLYAMMQRLVGQHHPDIAEAQIGLAWNGAWSADVDGKMQLGKTKKASDLDRELHQFDFIILLNESAWRDFNPEQRAALLDHELCHCAPDCDDDGEQKQDERGRFLWRVRKHDVEEFHDVVKRHGCWKSDLEQFAKDVASKRQAPLLEAARR